MAPDLQHGASPSGRALAAEDWELLFDSIEVPIAMVESDRTLVRANEAFAALLGARKAELPGRKCPELLCGERCCPSEDSRGVAELVRGDRAFEIARFPLRRASAPARWICVLTDQTQQKQIIARMLQSEKLAAVGQLASGLAHELNNPLGGILAFTQLMLREPGRAAADQETLREIEAAALRCKKLVDSLLKLGRRGPVEGMFDLNRAAEDAALLFQAELKSRPHARFEQRLAPGPLPAQGDSSQIAHLVLNLLVNGLQALPDGKGRVSLETRADGEQLAVRVSDDGVGIPPEARDRIFDPLYTGRPPGAGAGLGLAICWTIAESHRGSIAVDSTLNRGSAFTLRLPRVPAGARPEEAR